MKGAVEGFCVAAKRSKENLPRLSASALGKRREFASSAPPFAPGSRPYATPDQLRNARDQPSTSRIQPPASDVLSHLTQSPTLGPSAFISEEYLEHLYSVLIPSPLTALAALAARIPKAKLGAEHTSLIELCCIHPSFWESVDDAQPMAADRKGPFTNFWDDTRGSNAELAALGESMLNLFAIEHLDALYPHLPERIMREAIELTVGMMTCADIARTWGIFAGSTSRARPMSVHELRSQYGMHAGQGLLRWRRKSEEMDQLDEKTGKSVAVGSFTKAMSSVAKAVVGVVFQEHGWEQTRLLVHSNWLSRKVDLKEGMNFVNPKMVLMETLLKYGRDPPTTRLLKEAGRDSAMPIFVVGSFSGKDKLGEGYGSSVRMAENRSATHALRRIYLQRSFAGDNDLPDFHTAPVLPSETLIDTGRPYEPRPLGDDEVQFGNLTPSRTYDEQQLQSVYRARAASKPPPRVQASLKRPSRGPGSKDPSLPLEDRIPRFQWKRVAGGPPGRREKANDRPVRPLRPDELQTSPYYGPFDERARHTWSRAQQIELAQQDA